MKVAVENTKAPAQDEIVLEARNIVKRYGHVTALDGANLEKPLTGAEMGGWS